MRRRRGDGLGTVVLAGTSGSRLFPVTEQVPKALLPVGNRPLVSYLLASLKRCDAGRVVVVTTKRFEGVVRSAVASEDPTVVTVDEMRGSAGAVKEALKKDEGLRRCSSLLVVAGESVVGPRCLSRLVERHRLVGAGCTALFGTVRRPSQGKGVDAADVEVIALAEDGAVAEKKPLLEIHDDADEDTEPAVRLAKAVLRRSPRLEIRADLADVHCYVFDVDTLADFLDDDDTVESLKADVLPALADAYFRSKAVADEGHVHDAYDAYQTDIAKTTARFSSLRGGPAAEKDDDENDDPAAEADDDDDKDAAATIRATAAATSDVTAAPFAALPVVPKEERGKRPLIAVILEDDDDDDDKDPGNKKKDDDDDDDVLGADLAVRIDKTPLYAALCRRCVSRACARPQLQETATFPVGKLSKRDGTLIGPETVVGEKVTLKNASVGARCRIGSKAKINNSVLFDDVIVHDGAVIQNSIVCANAVVKDKANLNDVQVGANAVVPPHTTLKNESFLADDDDDEEEVTTVAEDDEAPHPAGVVGAS